MDKAVFLQQLRNGSLEEGRAYLIAHSEELADHDLIGNELADEALARLYSPFLSLKLAELLTFFGEYTHHLPSHALGLKAKGDALSQARLHQAALDSLDAAARIFLCLEDEENWARSRISWIVAATSLGRVEDALHEAAKARAVFQRLDQPYWVCIIDHNTCWVYKQIGRYQEINALYERMLEIYPTVQGESEVYITRAMAMARENLAINLCSLGDFERAYLLEQQALESYRNLAEMDMVVNAEMTLADFDYDQGYYGSALRRYYQAQDLLEEQQLDNPKIVAYLKLQIARILVKVNRPQEALQMARDAVTIHRSLALSLETMDALREYASVLTASGLLKDALVVLEEALALFERGGLEHYILATRLQQAEVLLQTRAFARAYQEASALKVTFEAQGLIARSTRADLVALEALLGLAEEAREDEQRAQFLHMATMLGKQASLQAQHYHLQEEAYHSQFLLGRLYAMRGDYTRALRRYQAAIAQIERMLDDLSYDLSPSFLHTAWAVYAETITLYLQQGQDERAFSYLESSRSLALRQYLNRTRSAASTGEGSLTSSASSDASRANNALILRTQEELKIWQERYHKQSVLLTQVDLPVSPTLDLETLQAELKHCETRINELFERLYLQQATRQLTPQRKKQAWNKTPPLDSAQFRQYLKPDQLLLAYFLHKERLVIFAATRERLGTRTIPDGMLQLRRLLPLLHAHLQPGGWPNPKQPPQLAIRLLLRKLYTLLIAPAAEYLPETSGELTIVPYGPLHTLPFQALYDGASFLVEQFRISYLPASNLLTQAQAPAPDDASHASRQTPLVFGYSGQGHLQHALIEAQTLAHMLDARCYLEEEATIAHLVAQTPGSPIIHLATHGQSRLDAPNFSAIILADGRFNAIDAFSLDLRNCELVALSGCETGLALTSGGDEQIGLGRAFLAAGAQSLVMSLWPVEDSATCELMQLFYQYLLQGASKIQALCNAQRTLIQASTSAYTHPYYWAAFRLVGETGPLSGR